MDEFVIGLRLMKVRQNRGLTQEQVAKKAQLNLADYQAMEEGKLLEDKERLEKACTALDIKVEDLFDSNTYINYGEVSGSQAQSIGTLYNNNPIFNQRNEEDITFMKDMANNLRMVSEHLDVLNHTIIQLFERLDDNVLKKRMEDIIKDLPNKDKRKGN